MTGTILLGDDATGKSRFARATTKHEKKYVLDGHLVGAFSGTRLTKRINALLMKAPLDTTLIYIDDVPANKLSQLLISFLQGEIYIQHPTGGFSSIAPKVMIICYGKIDIDSLCPSFLLRFTFITCLENTDHEVLMRWHHSKVIDPVQLTHLEE